MGFERVLSESNSDGGVLKSSGRFSTVANRTISEHPSTLESTLVLTVSCQALGYFGKAL